VVNDQRRADLPYVVGAMVIAGLLVGNAGTAADAAPAELVDLGLVALTAVALAGCRRYPLLALAVTTPAMLAFQGSPRSSGRHQEEPG
jgi:hypothetical protein